MLNTKSLFLLQKTITFLTLLVILGCANRQPPGGGPRDHDPPKLLKASPANMTRNFTAKVIQLDFDEFFKLTNTYQEVTIRPEGQKLPEYTKKKKSLIITLKDTLEKNTTYVINFGKAIVDVNEGNVLKNFTYVFSTGQHIDSLSISGSVFNTETQEREKEATVLLFTLKQDSMMFGKKKPYIYTSTDTAGNFSLNNLRPDDYRIYALKEKTANKIFDNDNELIAFIKNTIHLTTDTSNVKLKLYKQVPIKFRFLERPHFDPDGKMTFLFNKRLDKPELKIISPANLNNQKIVEFSKTSDTATLYMKNMDFDSLKIQISENSRPLDTIMMRKGRKETFLRTLTFSYNINNDLKLKPGTDVIIKANYPIESFDPNAILLKEDSTELNNYTITADTANKKLFYLNYRWRQNTEYTITINAGAFTDIYRDKNTGMLKRFKLDKQENYSQLTIKLAVPDTSKAYIVELLSEKKDILKTDHIQKNTTLVYKNYRTGKYRLRVIYDDNKNGKWDSGNVSQKQQPENIWLNPEIITLRPNWEQEMDITIPKQEINP